MSFHPDSINNNSADALKLNNGELDVPLVICLRNNRNQDVYVGFVPGFVMKNIAAEDYESCRIKLKEYVKERIKSNIKNKIPFPTFPNEEQIMHDFSPFKIEWIKIRVKA